MKILHCTLSDCEDEGIHDGNGLNGSAGKLRYGTDIMKLSILLNVKTEVKHSNELNSTKTYNYSLH